MSSITKFNKGEMYWYINPFVKKEDYLKKGKNQDFISNRPVLIISDYVDEYESSVIIVSTTTSPHRFGIEVDVPDENGEMVKGKIMPMRIREVPVAYLKSFVGRVSDDILNKVYESLGYHLGQHNEMPEYVKESMKMREKIKNTIGMKTKKEDKYNKRIIANKKNTKPKKSPKETEETIESKVYSSIKRISKQTKNIYESIASYKDKYLIATKDEGYVSNKYKITVTQAINIKKLCSKEFEIEKQNLSRKIMSHEIELNSMSNKDKFVFLSMNDDELKAILKNESVIGNIRRKFKMEMDLL